MVRRGRASTPSVAGAAFVVGAIVVLLAGCAPGDDAAGETSAALEVSASITVAAPPTTAASTTTVAPTTAEAPLSSPAEAATTVQPVPEQPVPGIDSDDPFCRSWSEFAGSFQALTFASIEAADPLVGARLEVVAAGAVTAAARSLDGAFPDEIADEREVFVDDVIGPFARRAARAADELRSAGAGDDDVELLGDAWLAALVAADAADPVFDVVVPVELDAAVAAATTAFAADVPPIAADPSLVTQAEAPATLAYLAARCPDQGILAGNDAVE